MVATPGGLAVQIVLSGGLKKKKTKKKKKKKKKKKIRKEKRSVSYGVELQCEECHTCQCVNASVTQTE
jgi:hypothetical protein